MDAADAPQQSAPSLVSDEDARALADHSLDAIAGLLRAYGERSYDIDGAEASQTRDACETWARHVMVGTPAHPSHQRVEVPEPGAERADAGAAGASEPAPPPIERDFRNLLRFFTSHRTRENGYVTQSLADLRQAIWTMVQSLRGSIVSDRGSDALASEHLRRLATAVEGRSTEKIRREARECVQIIGGLIEERAQRQNEQIAELGEKLRTLRRELEAAWEQTARDPLTGLGNRAAFHQQVERVVEVGFLFSEPAYLFKIDVDHFKWVNDSYGHPVGDALLVAVANALRGSFLRQGDVVARYGGGEFAALVRTGTDESAATIGERVLFAVREACVSARADGGEEVRVTASIGLAVLEPGESTESWLRRADAALDEAKSSGRDRVCAAAPAAAAPDERPAAAGTARPRATKP